MKKQFFLVLLVLMIATLSMSSAARVVTLWSYAQNNVDEWTKRKPDIDKKFNIDLQIVLVAQNAFVQKLNAVMMDGKGVPDIIEWMIEQNMILNADAKKCQVLPLDSYVASSKVFKDVLPGRVSWVKYGTHTYGLPHDTHPVVMIYNDTLWKSVGVDLSTITTWDEFFEAAKKLTAEKADGKPVHYALPYGGTFNDTMFMIWQQTGAQVLDKNGKPTLDTPEFKSFVSKFADWYKTGAFISWDWGGFPGLLSSGQLASYISPDWWVSQVDQAAKEGKYQFKVMKIPAYKKGGVQSCSWGGTFMAIPKGTKNPADIYKIMEYMQYDTEALLKVRYPVTGMLPPFASVWSNDVFNQPDPRFGGQKLGALQVQVAKIMPPVITGDLFWNVVANDMGPTLADVYTGKSTVDQAIKTAQDKAMAEYNDMMKKKK